MRICKLLAAVCFILFTFNIVDACSCSMAGPPCNYYGSTDAIFLGRVVGSAQRKSYTDEKGNKTVFDVGTIRFLVQENYKGVPGYEVEIHSGTGGGDCGYWFLRNESYVVYAYRDPESKELFTNICTRTTHISRASEDLEYLRGIADAKSGATLYGSLMRLIGDSYFGPVKEGPKMAGVKITVTGAGQTIETVTNDKGEYKLTGLPPGDYDAFPQLPDNLAAVSNRDDRDDFGRFTGRRPLSLVDRGCGEISFSVHLNGMISGKVTNAEGEPAKEVKVTLASGDDGDKVWWTWTDKDGHYDFVRVQPGSYLLGFNLKWGPDHRDPYPKTYYSGVNTRSEAALITIDEGEKLKGYDMTVPPSLTQREVKVTVVWPDGTPVKDGYVMYEMIGPKSMGDNTRTDEKGTAVVRLFDNYRYIIYADGDRDENEVYASPIEIFVDKKLKPLKFVVNKKGNAYNEIEALKKKFPKP